MFVVGTMNDHLQERLGDLNTGSLISQFQALDHTLWPPVGDSRATKEAFVIHGKAEVTALCDHYAALLERQGATKEDTLHEYRLYKSWARSRVTSARETFLALLQRGNCSGLLQCLLITVLYTLWQCSIVMSASRGPTEQVPLHGHAGRRLPDDGSQHGGLRARLQLHEACQVRLEVVSGRGAAEPPHVLVAGGAVAGFLRASAGRPQVVGVWRAYPSAGLHSLGWPPDAADRQRARVRAGGDRGVVGEGGHRRRGD